MMKLKLIAKSDTPSISGEPVPPPLPTLPAKSKRKLYSVLGLISIAVVVSALVLVFLVPRGLGETIPYSFNYSVGEKMTYNITMSESITGLKSSVTGTVDIEILSFDGANYTINETGMFMIQGVSQPFSYTLKMDKSGRMVDVSNISSEMQSMYSAFGMMPGFSFPSNKTEARVGETWQFPLNLNSLGYAMSGTIDYKFDNVQNITVPAGTFKAFEIDVSTDNIHASIMGTSLTMSMNGQLHQEYGTCRLLDLNLQVTMNMAQGTQTMAMSMSMQIQLTQLIKP
jgi:hypothetical protein